MSGAAPPLSAAILAGGQSRRMGADKALLRLAPGGPTLVERVAAAVAAVAAETLVVERSPDPVLIVRFSNGSFFGRLREKMGWGGLSDRDGA